MKTDKIITGLCLICLLFGVTGCMETADTLAQSQVTGLDKLGEVQVVSREEGSGTRSTFAQLAGFDQSSGEQTDLTREDAVVKNNAEEVIEAVKNETASIGYVSRGALADAEGVKALSINGVGIDTKNSQYPLSRSFYLVYTGKLSELEQDFLTYVHGAGQELVEKSYVPVAKSSTFLSNKEKGRIEITGSTSVAPLMKELAQAYMELNPNAVITVVETDSTDGINRAMAGECDMGMSSRDLEDYERELLDYEIIANDDIAVIVNADNPLSDITLDMLKRIYVGDIQKWEELNKSNR